MASLESANRAWRARPCCAALWALGRRSRIHTFKIERLSEDSPIILEIVDVREKLEAFLELIDGEIQEGLATIEKAHIRFYRNGEKQLYVVECAGGGCATVKTFRASRTNRTASSDDSAKAVRWPILRPRRASVLP